MISAALPTLHAATESFLKESGIHYATPTSPEYPSLHAAYFGNPAKPLVITRPKSAADVQALVRHCVADGVPFTVRGGGHDIGHRSLANGALTIDLRNLDSVAVAADKKTARLGGGVLFAKVLEALAEEQLTAAVGGIGTVGYTGWSTLGGYGPFSPLYGQGVDQIVGAKLVDARGELVDADEKLLRGIRGAGGSFGVIVELVIKVYPSQEIQAGQLVYDSSDLTKTITAYFTNLVALTAKDPIPPTLYLQPSVFNLPGLGPTFMSLYVWTGTASAASAEWLARVSGLAPLVASQVKTTTPLTNISETTTLLPSQVFGQCHTASWTHYSPEAVALLTRAAARMPRDPGTGMSIHSLMPASPSCVDPAEGGSEAASRKAALPQTVWRYRQPHLMVEFIGCGATPEGEEAAKAWAAEAAQEAKALPCALEGTYWSLTAVDRVDVAAIYGAENLAFLKGLKEEVDPGRVFKRAGPDL